MNRPMRDLMERLVDGDVGAVILAGLPGLQRQALRRCAAQRSFDEALYETVLRPSGGPPFQELLATGYLELAPGERERYRVSVSLQEAAFADWWVESGLSPGALPVPPKLQALAAAAARHNLGAGRPLDALDQLLLFDLSAASAQFSELYDYADSVFDLASCKALLEILQSSNRFFVLDYTLREVLIDRSSYLAARTLWRLQYRQSANYVPRRALEHALEDLLQGDSGRMLQLYGRGGTGKTMQLHWFIARRCVPAPYRIPCACIDFNLFDPITALRHPWLLLLEIATQLEGQFPYAPFQELLADYRSYRVLGSQAEDLRGSEVAAVRTANVNLESISSRLASSLTEATAGRPVVIVLDSLEEVLLRPYKAPFDLMGVLGRLRDVPALRFVLAGRYDLRDRLPWVSTEILGLRSIVTEGFNYDEQSQYLREIRGIADPALVEAIIQGSGGTPFIVSLFADVVDLQPDITPEDLDRATTDLNINYIVNRVLGRIDDDQVRWLVRYGVVPRVLTFRLLTDVLISFLEEAMAGTALDDDPTRDQYTAGIWRQGQTAAPHTAQEVHYLWSRLLTYTSSSSWVVVAPRAEDAVQFHPDLVGPLRRLLRRQGVYARLNVAAARHFERLAQEEAQEWASHMCQAIFHRFQADPVTGVEAWRRVLAEARVGDRRDWAFQISQELLSPDYADAEQYGDPSEWLSPQTLAEAHLEHARAAAEFAFELNYTPAVDSLWSEAEAAFGAAQAQARSVDMQLPEPAATVVEVHLLIARGHRDEAKVLLRERRAVLGSSPEFAELEQAIHVAIDIPQISRVAGLTPRELEVLRLVAVGRSNSQIGEALSISTKTAEAHVSRILAKLGVRSRIEAADTAHRLGLDDSE